MPEGAGDGRLADQCPVPSLRALSPVLQRGAGGQITLQKCLEENKSAHICSLISAGAVMMADM